MGTDAAATVTAIEQARERLGRDLDVLEARLPDRDDLVRAAAVGAGAVVAAVGSVWIGWSRYRRKRDRRELIALFHEAGVQAQGPPPPTHGGAWRFLLGGVVAGALAAGGYAAVSRQLDAGEQTQALPDV